MISFSEIAERLKNGHDQFGSYDNKKFEEDWKPERCTEYVLPLFNPLSYSNAKGAKTKWRNRLINIYTFIDRVRYLRYKEGCTIIPIPTTSRENLDIWGTAQSVANARKDMCEMGLISPHTTDISFRKGCAGKCFTYKYFKENEDRFIQFCNDNNIEPRALKNDRYDDVADLPELQNINKTKVQFATHLRLDKPKGISANKFEKHLTKILYENYPALQFYQRLADAINKTLYTDTPQLKIKFLPHFTWSESGKSITSIGIRATNKLVSTSKKDRPQILSHYGFIYEKDVKSSVPRLTRSMHFGAWCTEEIDFYEEIYKICEPHGNFTQIEREAIKKLYMRAYFDNSLANIGYHTWRDMEQSDILEKDVRDKMTVLRKAVEEVSGGNTFGNEIFYIESCVYLGALFNLILQGYETWVLYDCFYCKASERFKPAVYGFRENFICDVEQAISLGFDYFLNYKKGEDYDIDKMLKKRR